MNEPTRNILVCVSGMSPAVITETLYALVTQHQFVPTEIHVITTLDGKHRIERDLLQEATGAFHAFMRDYLPGETVLFDSSTIHLIGAEGGQALRDIQTDDDNRRAANSLYQVLRELKSKPGARLHASVAGGRKSMSFYMGHAFSLVADLGDQITHVLVNEEFEGLRGFYYPPRQSQKLQNKSGTGEVNTADAQVQLAFLSVLRLGSILRELPERALHDFEYAVKIAQHTYKFEPPEVKLVWSKLSETGHAEVLGEKIDIPNAEFKMLVVHACVLKEPDAFGSRKFVSNKAVYEIIQMLDGGGAATLKGPSPKSGKTSIDAKMNTNRSRLSTRLSKHIGTVGGWLVPMRAENKSLYGLEIPAHCIRQVGIPGEWLQVIKDKLSHLKGVH